MLSCVMMTHSDIDINGMLNGGGGVAAFVFRQSNSPTLLPNHCQSTECERRNCMSEHAATCGRHTCSLFRLDKSLCNIGDTKHKLRSYLAMHKSQCLAVY